MLRGKKILLGVCGSIAAYKSALLTRLLVKEGAEVKLIMTKAASHFITPLTLSTLSKNPVLLDFYKRETGEWQSHVELGLWADLFLIAPLSANTMASMANGICNNLLTAVYLSARCPVMLAPAMDLDMFQHPATRKNLQTLQSFGNHVLASGYGELASGLTGEGRMLEPEEILVEVNKIFLHRQPLAGIEVMVTTGPTHEAFDPVRYLGNHSSGKMGYAIATQLADAGAQVHLISGPTNLNLHHPNINISNVSSADEMYQACKKVFFKTKLNVFAAAVADYKPAQPFKQKIKKGMENLEIALEKNIDIAMACGKEKQADQINIGFALETENELDNAYLKLKKKNFDLIVLNSLNDAGAGFAHDTNKIKIIDKNNKIKDFELKDKNSVAKDIVKEIIGLIK